METLIDDARMENIEDCVRAVKNIPGAIVEIGVYKGGSLETIASVETKKPIYGLDTFSGLAEKTEGVDLHKVGWFNDTSFEAVKKDLMPYKNVTVMKGTFPSDFYSFDPGRISLCHVDVDMYESTKKCMDWAAAKMPVGGIIICDDYSCFDTPGAKLAVHEFLEKNGIVFEVIKIVNCQITLRKML
jgi:O-methyltransferase